MKSKLVWCIAALGVSGCGGQGGLDVGSENYALRAPLPWEEGQSSKLFDDRAFERRARLTGVDANGQKVKIAFTDDKIEAFHTDGSKLTGTELIGVIIDGEHSGPGT